MRQAKTLKDAEIKRVLAYWATRQHALRDTTIFVFSLHAGLRAKELAALRICDVYDNVGNVHSSFVLSAAATTWSAYSSNTLACIWIFNDWLIRNMLVRVAPSKYFTQRTLLHVQRFFTWV